MSGNSFQPRLCRSLFVDFQWTCNYFQCLIGTQCYIPFPAREKKNNDLRSHLVMPIILFFSQSVPSIYKFYIQKVFESQRVCNEKSQEKYEKHSKLHARFNKAGEQIMNKFHSQFDTNLPPELVIINIDFSAKRSNCVWCWHLLALRSKN